VDKDGIQQQIPHTWHDIAKSIINNFNKSSYIDDTDMDDEEYECQPNAP
jgi:hypothetical protein